jgi:HEAT repeat protein
MTPLASLATAGSVVLAGLVVVLLLAVGGEHLTRTRRHARDVRRRSELTPLVHALLDGDPVADVASAPALLDDLVLDLLPQLRGADRAALQAVLLERGVVTRAAGQLGARGAARRGRAALLLGNAASLAHTAQLVALLGDRASEVRSAAARALGKTGDPDAADPLLAATTARPGLPPGVAGMALLDLGTAALPALRAALDTGAPVARSLAADLIGVHGDPVATDALIRLVDDPAGDPDVRRSAAQALGRIGSPAATGTLAAAVPVPGDAPLQAAAAEALGRIGDPAGLDALTTGLRSPTPEVRAACADGLALFGEAGRIRLAAHAVLRGPSGDAARSALDVLTLSHRPSRHAARS